MKRLCAILVLFALVGCEDGPSIAQPIVGVQGLEGCLYTKYKGMQIVRCPTTTSIEYQDGKVRDNTVVIETVPVEPDNCIVVNDEVFCKHKQSTPGG